MLTESQLNAANAYGEWLRLAVHERELPANQVLERYKTRMKE